MNTLKILLPYNYVKNLVSLTWYDIFFAIEQGFFNQEAAIEYAVDLIAKEQEPSRMVLELACLTKGESIYPYIDELAKQVPKQDDCVSHGKFLYVLLNWVYEHRYLYADPLEVVEFIYADFDYPEEVSGFVRFMPTADPILDSLELNRERLFNKWGQFLEKQKALFSSGIH